MSDSSITPIQGIKSYQYAHQWLKRTGRLRWLLIPLIIASLLFPAYVYGVYYTSTGTLDWLVGYFGWETQSWGYWLSFPVVVLMVLFLGYIIIKNLIMILCIPLNAYLADKMMDDELGYPTQETPLIKSIIRALVMTLFAVFIGLISTIILIAIGFIPIVGAIIALVLGVLIQGFLAGLGFFDPVFERLNYPARKSLLRCFRLIHHVENQGIPFVIIFQIPILGWALAPTYGTLAGVYYATHLHQQGKLLPQSFTSS